jgi:tRNA (cytidine32/guanosine34-2'-O)-methyltransferase
MLNPLLDYSYSLDHQVNGLNRVIAPFLACGDLEYDADATYELPEGHVVLDVVQPPINPPYMASLRKKMGEASI